MKKSSLLTLQQLDARLQDQTLEIVALRAALEVQFTRIAHMQAELDVLPRARRRRQALKSFLTSLPSHNGNGHTNT